MPEQSLNMSVSATQQAQQALDVSSVLDLEIFESVDQSEILQNGCLTELGISGLSLIFADTVGKRRTMVPHEAKFFTRSEKSVVSNASRLLAKSNTSCNHAPGRACDFEQTIDYYRGPKGKSAATGDGPSMPAGANTLKAKIDSYASFLLEGHEHLHHSQAATEQQTEEELGGSPEESASHRGSGQ